MLLDAWDDSTETDISSQRPIDAQFQKTLTFINKHEELLCQFNLSDVLHYGTKTSTQKIRVALDPAERVAIRNIVPPDDANEQLRKIMNVLVFLCDEVNELKEIADEKFFAPLIMFGRLPTEHITGD